MNTHNLKAAAAIALPVGEKIGWDTAGSSGEGKVHLYNMAESGVLAESLKRSREKWLRHTFRKFQSKARGSKEPPPPNHISKHRGRCNVVIGPHTFADTEFYEVYILPPYPQAGSQTGNTMSASKTTSPLDASASQTSFQFAPTMSQIVKETSASNPIFGHFMAQARAGKASAAEGEANLRMVYALGTTISNGTPDHMGKVDGQMNFPLSIFPSGPDSYGAQLFHAMASPPPCQLVIEFKEIANEQWLVPPGPALFDLQPNGKDATLTLRLPFDDQVPVEPEAPNKPTQVSEEDTRQAVSLILKSVPELVSATLTRWIGGEEKMKEYRDVFNALGKPRRVYLGYHLPPGRLKADLEALAQPYPMKLLKHGPTVQRAPRPRKPPVPKTKPPAVPNVTQHQLAQSHIPQNYPPQVCVPQNSILQSYALQSRPIQGYSPQQSQPSQAAKNRQAPAPKRQKTTHKLATEIACLVCHAKEVPLILGGRFCRPCVESGAASKDPSYHIAPYPRPYMMASSSSASLPPSTATGITPPKSPPPIETTPSASTTAPPGQ